MSKFHEAERVLQQSAEDSERRAADALRRAEGQEFDARSLRATAQALREQGLRQRAELASLVAAAETSPDVASIAARGVKDGASLTSDEVQSVSASALRNAAG